MESVKPAAPPEAILQLKVRLLGISPMMDRACERNGVLS